MQYLTQAAVKLSTHAVTCPLLSLVHWNSVFPLGLSFHWGCSVPGR